MTPAEVSCAHCAQQPYEICVNPDRTPFLVDGVAAFHAERYETAAAETQGDVSAEAFRAAVEAWADSNA